MLVQVVVDTGGEIDGVIFMVIMVVMVMVVTVLLDEILETWSVQPRFLILFLLLLLGDGCGEEALMANNLVALVVVSVATEAQ